MMKRGCSTRSLDSQFDFLGPSFDTRDDAMNTQPVSTTNVPIAAARHREHRIARTTTAGAMRCDSTAGQAQ